MKRRGFIGWIVGLAAVVTGGQWLKPILIRHTATFTAPFTGPGGLIGPLLSEWDIVHAAHEFTRMHGRPPIEMWLSHSGIVDLVRIEQPGIHVCERRFPTRHEMTFGELTFVAPNVNLLVKVDFDQARDVLILKG